jgi:DNA-directed RNA polymerase subunit RPC12/RpoP
MDKYEEVEMKLKAWEAANPTVSLTEIEETVDRELATVRREMIERIIGAREGRGEGISYKCPNCQEKMSGNGYKKRELKTKGGEKLELERQQLRCHQCGMTLFPPR